MMHQRQHIIHLPRLLGMTSMHELTQRMTDIIYCCSQREPFALILDMRQVRFIHPASLATLTALMVYMTRQELVIHYEIMPPNKRDLQQYLDRMHFYQALDLSDALPYHRRTTSGHVREVVEVTSEDMVNAVTIDLVDLLDRHIEIAPHVLRSLHFPISEIIDNVFHHAQSPVNAIVCAQAYPTKRRVEIAIADCGRGFQQSLCDNPALVPDVQTSLDALQVAIQHHTTGRPDRNAGMGLFFTAELVRQNGGDMLIYSGDGMLAIKKGQTALMPQPRWMGSVVSFRLLVDQPLDMPAVFRQHDPREEDDWDADGDTVFDITKL